MFPNGFLCSSSFFGSLTFCGSILSFICFPVCSMMGYFCSLRAFLVSSLGGMLCPCMRSALVSGQVLEASIYCGSALLQPLHRSAVGLHTCVRFHPLQPCRGFEVRVWSCADAWQICPGIAAGHSNVSPKSGNHL